MEFINLYSTELITLVALIFLVTTLGYLWVTGKKALVIQLVYQFVSLAENAYREANSGKTKSKYVIDSIYSIIPIYLHAFITRDYIQQKIDLAVKTMETYLQKKVIEQELVETNIKSPTQPEDAEEATTEV